MLSYTNNYHGFDNLLQRRASICSVVSNDILIVNGKKETKRRKVVFVGVFEPIVWCKYSTGNLNVGKRNISQKKS